MTEFRKSFYEDHRDKIILDTGCSVPALFCNPDLVLNIHSVDEPLCMATSTGVTKVHQKSTVPGIGEVWYDPGQPTNLLSYGHMQERFKVTYQERTDTFDLKMKEGTLKFEKQDYLYIHQPSDKYIANIAATKGITKKTKPKITVPTRYRSASPEIGLKVHAFHSPVKMNLMSPVGQKSKQRRRRNWQQPTVRNYNTQYASVFHRLVFTRRRLRDISHDTTIWLPQRPTQEQQWTIITMNDRQWWQWTVPSLVPPWRQECVGGTRFFERVFSSTNEPS